MSHFEYPEDIPPEDVWLEPTYKEVKKRHAESHAVLAQREDLQPPTCMQDTTKTLEIYEDVLYPALTRLGLDSIIVEDNASPHNNEEIRNSHRRHNVNIVGYNATEGEKEDIKALIRQQCTHTLPPRTRQKGTDDEANPRVSRPPAGMTGELTGSQPH